MSFRQWLLPISASSIACMTAYDKFISYRGYNYKVKFKDLNGKVRYIEGFGSARGYYDINDVDKILKTTFDERDDVTDMLVLRISRTN